MAAPPLPPVLADVVNTAIGRAHRNDPVVGRTGGPAGNAHLTAWLGILLLIAFIVECATLVSLGQLMTVHIVVGVLLTALVLAKTASTGWRILRYYVGDPAYREAGPPPLALRVLGPLVVLGGLAILGTGLALVAIGRAAHQPLFSAVGFRVDAVTLHQAAFVLWFAVTVPHTLARLVPAWRLVATRQKLAGGAARIVAIAAVVGAAAIASGPVLHEGREWVQHTQGRDDGLARAGFSVLR